MWRERQYQQLKDEIENTVLVLSDTSSLHTLVKESLEKTGPQLAEKNDDTHPWPLLPLIVCESICGSYEQALPVASTLYLLKTSAEIFDDIEDADFPESLSAKYGSDIATNIGTTLLILAERCITNLERRGVEPHIIVRAIDVINAFYITACAGQHLDLLKPVETAISEESYLHIIEAKSASSIQCACKVGALLATDNEKLIDKFSIFGHDLGMASQIANDVFGVVHGNDIMKRKVTLPVIYSLSQTKGKEYDYLEEIFLKRPNIKIKITQVKNTLFQNGAIHYATIKMEYYRQKAIDILSEIEKERIDINRLKLFLN